MNISREIIVKCLQQSANADEQMMLEQWLNESPANRIYYTQLRLVWDNADFSTDVQLQDQDEAWSGVISQITPTKTKALIPLPATSWLKIAATVMLVLGMALAYYHYATDTRTSETSIAVIEAASTSTNQEHRLPDGSKVVLMPFSTITYSSDFGQSRKLQLEGGAYFEVEKTAGLPFTVVARQTQVKVLGTRFLVKSDQRRTEVFVEEGRVEVGLPASNTKKTVGANQGVFVENNQTAIVELAGTANILSWKTGILEFENTKLVEVISALNKHYSVKIKLKNSDIGRCHLTSRFDNKSIDEVLQVLEVVLDVKIRATVQNEYLISGKGC